MSLPRRLVEIKYNVGWYIGTLLCLFLYFMGIAAFYVHIRRRYLKHRNDTVLMYHRIGTDNSTPAISVSLDRFDAQLSYLARHFEIVSLDDLLEVDTPSHMLAKDRIAITFDDGFKDNYTHAYPLLRKHNAPAAIFVVTGTIDRDPEMLTRNEIKDMRQGRVIFGSHTVTHPVLSESDMKTSLFEIRQSKLDLEGILQEQVKYFAYPKGKKADFTTLHEQTVREAGYVAAFSTENGGIQPGDDMFALRRLGIRDYPMFVFKVRLSGIFETPCVYALRRIVGLT